MPVQASEQPDVTQLLLRMEHGDRHAIDLLLPVVCRELRRLAAGYLQRERGCHTLQPTALRHEAYMRMVDHARSQGAGKRGGDVEKTPLGEELVAIDDALTALEQFDPAKAKTAATGVSVATVNRQWRMAKAWLFTQLQRDREK